MNRVELNVRLDQPAILRRTPAGVPTLRLPVSHRSTQVEAGRQREVALSTEIAAFGPVAEGLAKVAPGRLIRLIGFLDRKGANQLELHVTEFGIVEE